MNSFVIRKLQNTVANSQPHHAVHTGHPGHMVLPPMCHFFFLQSGTVLVDIGEKTYLIQAHQLVVIPAGQPFKVRYYEKSEGYMGGFQNNFIISESTSENPLSRFDFLRVWGSPKIELDKECYEQFNLLFSRIYREYTSQECNIEIIKAYMIAVLVEADIIYKKSVKDVVAHNNSLCNRFLEMLFKGDNPNIPLADCAQMLSISPNHLNKVVKKASGKSPSVWIEEAIILKAKILLKTTQLPLSDIAAKVGILDQSYFARKFKQHEGITPSEFRAQQI